MDALLTRDRLPDVVAEVDRIAQRQGGQIDRADAEGVLRELGLPPELLDEALSEIRKRDQRRASRRWLLVSAALVVVLGAGAVGFGMHRASSRAASFGQIETRDTHLAYDAADASSLPAVTRDGARDVFFAVTLLHAPLGATLPLECAWTDPSGALSRESRYQTKPIDRDAFPTHCKARIGSEAPTGTWRVAMKLEGKTIADRTFDVK